MRHALTPIQPFPVEGKGFDLLLPSMGRIPEGVKQRQANFQTIEVKHESVKSDRC